LQLKIVYIYHDCFAIISGGQALLFDYPENLSPEAEEALRNAVRGKNLITLTSHSHADHFTEKLLNLEEEAQAFTCIVSGDVAQKSPKCARKCLVIEERQMLRLDNLEVKAYGSSDLGVSYLVKIGDAKIYFAGDNADWSRSQLPEQVNQQIRETFHRVIREAAEEAPVDIAFATLCQICRNLGGISHVIRMLRPRLTVPMHLAGQTELIAEHRSSLEKLGTKIFAYTRPGDTYTYTT